MSNRVSFWTKTRVKGKSMPSSNVHAKQHFLMPNYFG